MLIIQEPTNGILYFQNSIPDIILEKTTPDTSIIFELKMGTSIILTESYTYDNNNLIYIRNLRDIVDKFFSVSEIYLAFNYSITEGASNPHNISFLALKCAAEINANAESWVKQNFLTRAFSEKRTSKSRNEFLSFIQRHGFGDISVNYKIYYSLNGSPTYKSGTLQTIGQFTDNVKTLNVSLGYVMSIAALPLDTIVFQYEIWLTGTSFTTLKYSFLVDNRVHRNRKFFVFTNCFGVLETFTTTGSADSNKTAEFNLANIQNHYRKISQDFVIETSQFSGFLSNIEMDWIDDLLISYNVSTYIPGVSGADQEITITSINKTDTENNVLQAFSFDYRKARNNHLEFKLLALSIFDFTFNSTFN